MMRPKKDTRKKVSTRLGSLVFSVTMASSLVLSVLPNERAYAEGGINNIYEAEDAVLIGAIADNQHAGYTGSGFVDYKPNAPGGSIEWTIPMTSSGEYDLEFRYANGGTDNRSADIVVNGVQVTNLPFEPTGEWSFWKTSSVRASLQEGDNHIAVIATGASGGANIDHMRIIDSSAPTEPVEPQPQELEEVPMDELISGLLSKKLNQSGLIRSSDDDNQDRPLTKIEFFARINRLMAYSAPELLDRYAPEEEIWGISKDHWSSYVVAAAQKAGYVKLPKYGNVNPNESITRKEAALLIANVLIRETLKKGKGVGLLEDMQEMASYQMSGSQSEEVMSQILLNRIYQNQRDLQKTLDQPVSLKEAEWFMSQLSSIGLVKPKQVEIVKVEAVASHLIAVITGSEFSQFNVSAIELRADAAGLSLPGDASSLLYPTRAAAGTNQYGDTVILYEIRETLHDGLLSGQSGNPAQQEVYVRAAANVKDVYNRSINTQQHVRVEDETKMLQRLPNQLIVAKDGSGDYTTVGEAIEAVPENNTQPVEIAIRNGIYEEVVTVPVNKPHVSFVGESAEHTIITYDNYAGREKPTGGTYGTSGSATLFLYANDFKATQLTIRNTFDRNSVETTGTQAVAVYARGERMVFDQVRLLGRQDTLYAHSGSQYYVNSYIEGDVDFIFGGARAVFDNCEIVSLDRGSSTNNGYITAASTQITQPYGYLFINSRLTSDAADGTVYLGRPWHPSGDVNAIGSVLFMNCEMGAHIHAEGWTNMSGFLASDARFFEYNNSGPGATISDQRRQLTAEQAQEYSIQNVLGGWNPIAD